MENNQIIVKDYCYKQDNEYQCGTNRDNARYYFEFTPSGWHIQREGLFYSGEGIARDHYRNTQRIFW